jgi:hypothetical protein
MEAIDALRGKLAEIDSQTELLEKEVKQIEEQVNVFFFFSKPFLEFKQSILHRSKRKDKNNNSLKKRKSS